MNGYHGTEAQQRLQRKSDRLTPWIMRTPGACLTGRLMGTDDPDRLGWDVIRRHLAEDGAFSFRWIDAGGRARIGEELAGHCRSIFGWDGFCGAAAELRPNVEPGGSEIRAEIARGTATAELQGFLAAQGITPLSAAVMEGRICRARSVLLRDATGVPVAGGFVGMLQNAHSPLHDCAWAGLIASAPDHRGQGLGRRVTGALVRIATEEFGAARVMGFAAADNAASRAMLEGCGLRPANRAAYVATLSDARFTR